MVALNLLVVLGLLHHDDLVDTALAGGGDGPDVEGGPVVGALPLVVVAELAVPLAGAAGVGLLVVVLVSVVMVAVGVLGVGLGAALVEGEGAGLGNKK